MLKAQLAGIAAARRPGVTGSGNRRQRPGRSSADAGYGAYFGHSFGHSLGVEIHESPELPALAIDKPMPAGAVGLRRAGHLSARAASACASRM